MSSPRSPPTSLIVHGRVRRLLSLSTMASPDALGRAGRPSPVLAAQARRASLPRPRPSIASPRRDGVAGVGDAASPAAGDKGARNLKKRQGKRRVKEVAGHGAGGEHRRADGGEHVEGAAGDAAEEEEVDWRAEEFISVFQHRLRVYSFSSLPSGSWRGSAVVS